MKLLLCLLLSVPGLVGLAGDKAALSMTTSGSAGVGAPTQESKTGDFGSPYYDLEKRSELSAELRDTLPRKEELVILVLNAVHEDVAVNNRKDCEVEPGPTQPNPWPCLVKGHLYRIFSSQHDPLARSRNKIRWQCWSQTKSLLSSRIQEMDLAGRPEYWKLKLKKIKHDFWMCSLDLVGISVKNEKQVGEPHTSSLQFALTRDGKRIYPGTFFLWQNP